MPGLSAASQRRLRIQASSPSRFYLTHVGCQGVEGLGATGHVDPFAVVVVELRHEAQWPVYFGSSGGKSAIGWSAMMFVIAPNQVWAGVVPPNMFWQPVVVTLPTPR
jgi:hypothetical protein